MAPRRSKVEIYLDILMSCQTLHLPTKIMYDANLSWGPMRIYIGELERRGLIQEVYANDRDERVKNVFYLTDRGLWVVNWVQREAHGSVESFGSLLYAQKC